MRSKYYEILEVLKDTIHYDPLRDVWKPLQHKFLTREAIVSKIMESENYKDQNERDKAKKDWGVALSGLINNEGKKLLLSESMLDHHHTLRYGLSPEGFRVWYSNHTGEKITEDNAKIQKQIDLAMSYYPNKRININLITFADLINLISIFSDTELDLSGGDRFERFPFTITLKVKPVYKNKKAKFEKDIKKFFISQESRFKRPEIEASKNKG